MRQKNEMKLLIKELVSRSRYKRKLLISRKIREIDYKPWFQRFETVDKLTGYNIIAEKGKGKSISISAHYDGNGAYDNASGVVVLLELMKKFREYEPINRIRFIFFDLEEILTTYRVLESGAEHYLENINRKRVLENVNIDGCGIGHMLIDLEHDPPVHVDTDADIFKRYGIPTRTFSTLPKKEALDLIKKRIIPKTWDIINTDKDTVSKISESSLRYAANEIYKEVVKLDRKYEIVKVDRRYAKSKTH